MKVRGCWTTWAPKPAKTTVVQQANLGLFCVVSGKSLEIFRSLTLYVYTVYIYIHLICCIILYIYIYILSTHVSFHVDGTVTFKHSHIVFSEFLICFSGVTCRFVNLHRPIGSCGIQVSLHHLLSSTSVLFVAGHNLQTLLCTSLETVPNLQFLFTSSLANNPKKKTFQPKKQNNKKK